MIRKYHFKLYVEMFYENRIFVNYIDIKKKNLTSRIASRVFPVFVIDVNKLLWCNDNSRMALCCILNALLDTEKLIKF